MRNWRIQNYFPEMKHLTDHRQVRFVSQLIAGVAAQLWPLPCHETLYNTTNKTKS